MTLAGALTKRVCLMIAASPSTWYCILEENVVVFLERPLATEDKARCDAMDAAAAMGRGAMGA